MRRLALLLATAAGAGLVAASVLAASGPPPLTPDDPGWPGQWALRLVGIPEIWQDTSPDAHPLIASVDTGIDPSFPDLTGQLVPGWNLLDNDADTGDTAGHGTDVAIVIAANANNGYGIAGACPMCQVMPVKISDDGTATSKLIAAGIRWAVAAGFDVINLSLATTRREFAFTLHELADDAYFRGALLVTSAHNMPVDSYPWRFSSVLSVASHGRDDRFEFHYNPRPPVEFFARGADVEVPWPGGGRVQATGNSFATPHISGLCALILAKHPQLTPFQVKTVLHATATNVTADR